jgi:hypothetical protein
MASGSPKGFLVMGSNVAVTSLPPAARALVAKQLVSRRAFRKILPWTDEFLMAAV